VRLAALILVLLAAGPAWAETSFSGSFTQGGLVIGQSRPGAQVTLDGQKVPVGADGRFLLGFGREARTTAILRVEPPAQPPETFRLAVTARRWDIQRIDGLPEKKVTPDPQTLERIKEENARLAAARALATPLAGFASGFVLPAEGRVSGIFGSQRILNGQPRAPHVGLDIAGPVGAPVWAAADGVVSLVEPDLFFTGQTVMIDHGLGLSSLYAHMSAIRVEPGQTVKKGDPIGAIGASGRATGAHLHWGLAWFEVRLDPELALSLKP